MLSTFQPTTVQPTRRAGPLRRAPLVVCAAARIAGSQRGTPQQQPPTLWPQPPPALAAAAVGCLAALLLGVTPPAGAKELIQGTPRVVDGDTLDFSGTRVRLFGIGGCWRVGPAASSGRLHQGG
jgi:endonuclease YncB( thermonuclease family)